MSKIMLIDGNSIINRAFYAIPLLTSTDGLFTNAVYGFLNIFQKLYDEEKPDHVAVAFDLPAPTFRHKLYEEYKGTRKPMPNELRPQIPLLKNLLRLMNISVYEVEGYEADDMLGSLARFAEERDMDVTIISGDRDLLQIATDKIQIRIPKTKGGKTEVENYYASDVLALIGVTPTEYIDVKALMGDASDNIPGVPGIGEKTALKIISEYKSVESAIENIVGITPKKAAENLSANRELAILSKRLAAINTSVPIENLPEAVSREEIYNGDAYSEIQRLGFRSLYTLFSAVENVKEKTESVSYESTIVKTQNDLERLVSRLCAAGTATFKLLCDGDIFLGMAFCCEDRAESTEQTASKRLFAAFVTVFGDMDEDIIFDICKPFFESSVKKLCHDLKKERSLLEYHGIKLENAVFDTMLAAYILDASRDSYDYNDIAHEYLCENYQSYEAFFGKGKAKIEYTILNNDDEKLKNFTCNQAAVIFRAYPVMSEKIESNGQRELYEKIELPLVDVLGDMERRGIKIDTAALKEFGHRLDGMISNITNEIYLLSGEEFNISSTKQLGTILFEKLGLKSGKKTKTGYSTSADVLQELAGKHVIVERILEYRTYTKLKSTYADGLLAEMRLDGKIHSTFNQMITTTGRISSTEPNLQNIPVRYELGRELRKIFIPSDEEHVFLDADYSQIELRILAHLSGDETFINAFLEGQDIHKLTAAQVFKMPLEFVSPEQRSNAKAVNFGIVYGISAYSLSQDLKISVKEAQRYIDGYFERYPKVKLYLDSIISSAREKGYAETMFGRRRNIPELRSSNFVQRSFGERAAMNMPIQGSAADIIKIAMVRVYDRLKTEGLKSRLILQVHDELLVEAPIDEADAVKDILRHEMENAVSMAIPLEAEVKRGSNWYEAH